MTAPRTHGVFISYRRQDAAFPAGWLYEQLVEHFGQGEVFKDVDSVALGDDFVEVITSAVRSCRTMLVVIGPSWLSITDEAKRQRLYIPGDPVRVEIETALRFRVPIIPVLVSGATMPGLEELPDSLALLARRNALEVSSNHFRNDLERLVRGIERMWVEADERARNETDERRRTEARRRAEREAEARRQSEGKGEPRRPAVPAVDAAASVRGVRWLVLLRGILAILFGLFALFAPGNAVLALVWLFAAYVLLDGVTALVLGIRHRTEDPHWVWHVVQGIVSVLVGVIALFWPGLTVLAILFVITFWSIVGGSVEIVGSLTMRKQGGGGWGWMLAAGIVSILFGIALLASPGAALITLLWLVGIWGIVFGVIIMVLAFRLGSNVNAASKD
jgi:uncharacterized membrane protein HdeD (DUF308 family)